MQTIRATEGDEGAPCRTAERYAAPLFRSSMRMGADPLRAALPPHFGLAVLDRAATIPA